MWARCVAAGVPDEVFWSSRLGEIELLLGEISARENALRHAANLRAGVVASTLVNMWRKKGAPLVKPEDFFRSRKPLSAEQFRANMLGWASDMQARGKGVAISTKKIEA